MKITIETIPHSQQRYNTCGDWQFDSQGNLNIRVSEMGDPRMNFLVARHELDEAMLCWFGGISQEEVDAYDFSHPAAGGDCFSDNLDAPYAQEHNNALAAEWQMARLLGVNWEGYIKRLEELSTNPTGS